MTETTPTVLSPIVRRDIAVKAILGWLTEAVEPGDTRAFSKAAATIRLAVPITRQITSRQRAALIEALGEAHKFQCFTSPIMTAPAVTTGCNALGSLILGWAGDRRWTPGAGPFDEAVQLASAFELQLAASVIWASVLTQQATRSEARSNMFSTMAATAGRESKNADLQ